MKPIVPVWRMLRKVSMGKRHVLAVLWIALAIACRDDELHRLEAIRDEVCACKTAECGDAAMKKVPVVESAGDRRTQMIARAMVSCLAKLYQAERPDTGPDQEAPAEPEPAPAAP